MRIWRLGVRSRVLIAVLLTVAVAQVGSVLVLRQVLVAALDARVDAGLEQEAAELRQLAAGVDPSTGEPFGDDFQAVFDVFLSRNVPGERETFVTILNGKLYRSTQDVAIAQDEDIVRSWRTSAASRRERVQVDRSRVDYLSVPMADADSLPNAVFVALYDYEGERAEIDEALERAEIVAVALLLVAAALGWSVAGRALAPLRRLTEAAHSIGSGRDLERRLPAEPGSDEVATLTRTFNAMLNRLDAAFAIQRDFVADAGHELRTPITIVRGHLELLGDEPADQQQTIALVTGELDRMTRMVDDLLTLAKLGRPEFLNLGPVHVPSLLKDATTNAAVLGDRLWAVSGAPRIHIRADRQRLTQALMQLTANAVAHSEPGSPITLGGAVADSHLYLWVIDAGVGVPDVDRQRIFERFVRTIASRRRAEGSGLGLAIVTAVATAHDGWPDVLSTEGVGSAFVLALPAPAEQDPGGEQDSSR